MPQNIDTIVLFRPVNQAELDLVSASNWTKFPPRLSAQPIFYPVANEEYACQIARDWNVSAYGAGFVLRFEVSIDFISKYEPYTVGASHHVEYWIPANELDAFNSNIIGKIEVTQKYYDAQSDGETAVIRT